MKGSRWNLTNEVVITTRLPLAGVGGMSYIMAGGLAWGGNDMLPPLRTPHSLRMQLFPTLSPPMQSEKANLSPTKIVGPATQFL